MCSVRRDLAAGGFLCTPITLIASSLLCGCKKKKKKERPACCVNQFSRILQLLSNWVCTAEALVFSETRLCTLLDQYEPVFSVALRSQVDVECKQFETLVFCYNFKGEGVGAVI